MPQLAEPTFRTRLQQEQEPGFDPMTQPRLYAPPEMVVGPATVPNAPRLQYIGGEVGPYGRQFHNPPPGFIHEQMQVADIGAVTQGRAVPQPRPPGPTQPAIQRPPVDTDILNQIAQEVANFKPDDFWWNQSAAHRVIGRGLDAAMNVTGRPLAQLTKWIGEQAGLSSEWVNALAEESIAKYVDEPHTKAEAAATFGAEVAGMVLGIFSGGSLPAGLAKAGAKGAIRLTVRKGAGRLVQFGAGTGGGIMGFTAGTAIPQALSEGEGELRAVGETVISPGMFFIQVGEGLTVNVYNIVAEWSEDDPQQLYEKLKKTEPAVLMGVLMAYSAAMAKRPAPKVEMGAPRLQAPERAARPAELPPPRAEGRARGKEKVVQAPPGWVPTEAEANAMSAREFFDHFRRNNNGPKGEDWLKLAHKRHGWDEKFHNLLVHGVEEIVQTQGAEARAWAEQQQRGQMIPLGKEPKIAKPRVEIKRPPEGAEPAPVAREKPAAVEPGKREGAKPKPIELFVRQIEDAATTKKLDNIRRRVYRSTLTDDEKFPILQELRIKRLELRAEPITGQKAQPPAPQEVSSVTGAEPITKRPPTAAQPSPTETRPKEPAPTTPIRPEPGRAPTTTKAGEVQPVGRISSDPYLDRGLRELRERIPTGDTARLRAYRLLREELTAPERGQAGPDLFRLAREGNKTAELAVTMGRQNRLFFEQGRRTRFGRPETLPKPSTPEAPTAAPRPAIAPEGPKVPPKAVQATERPAAKPTKAQRKLSEADERAVLGNDINVRLSTRKLSQPVEEAALEVLGADTFQESTGRLRDAPVETLREVAKAVRQSVAASGDPAKQRKIASDLLKATVQAPAVKGRAETLKAAAKLRGKVEAAEAPARLVGIAKTKRATLETKLIQQIESPKLSQPVRIAALDYLMAGKLRDAPARIKHLSDESATRLSELIEQARKRPLKEQERAALDIRREIRGRTERQLRAAEERAKQDFKKAVDESTDTLSSGPIPPHIGRLILTGAKLAALKVARLGITIAQSVREALRDLGYSVASVPRRVISEMRAKTIRLVNAMKRGVFDREARKMEREARHPGIHSRMSRENFRNTMRRAKQVMEKFVKFPDPPRVRDAEKPISEGTLEVIAQFADLAKTDRARANLLKHMEFRRRIRRVFEKFMGPGTAEERLTAPMPEMAGELVRNVFDPWGNKLTTEQRAEIFDHIATHRWLEGRVLEQKHLGKVWARILDEGYLPTEGEIGKIELYFGTRVALPFMKHAYRMTGNPFWKLFSDAWIEADGIARGVLASFDHSNTLIQSAPLFWGYPIKGVKALGMSARAGYVETARVIATALARGYSPRAALETWGSEQYARAHERRMHHSPKATEWDAVGLERIRLDASLQPDWTARMQESHSRFWDLVKRAEPQTGTARVFLAPIKTIAAGIRASNRTFAVMSNELRTAVYEETAQSFPARRYKNDPIEVVERQLKDRLRAAKGMEAGAKKNRALGKAQADIESLEKFKKMGDIDRRTQLASFLNATTGRSTSPFGKAAAGRAGTAVFSKLPGAVLGPKTPWPIRKVALRQVFGTAAAIFGLYAALKLLLETADTDVEVVLDPRSTDFLRIKVRKGAMTTTFDPAGSVQEYIRRVVQIFAGAKNLRTGDIEGRRLADQIVLWVRYKAAPLASAGWTAVENKNAVGDIETIPQQFRDLFTPISLREAYEAIQAWGATGVGLAPFTQFGVVSTRNMEVERQIDDLKLWMRTKADPSYLHPARVVLLKAGLGLDEEELQDSYTGQVGAYRTKWYDELWSAHADKDKRGVAQAVKALRRLGARRKDVRGSARGREIIREGQDLPLDVRYKFSDSRDLGAIPKDYDDFMRSQTTVK